MVSQVKADVAVVGLGAMGSAALYQLAKRGVRPVGLDRFAPPHESGSSHGETRITRQAVFEGPAYVPFVTRSHAIWRDLEAATGETLYTACGVLVMGPGSGPVSHHGKPDVVSTTAAIAAAHGIAHEVLDGRAVARRFPQFKLQGTERAYYEPGGGYVAPERCISAQLGQAVALGATVQPNVAVTAIEPGPDHVRLETSNGTVLADRVVVSAGAWTAPLLGAPFDKLLTVTRQVLHWYELDDASAYGPDAPAYIWMHGAGDSDYFYGFPPLPNERRVKVATEQYGSRTTAEALERDVGAEESAAMYRTHVAGRLAGATGHVAAAAACLYTMTPDRGFIIDRHPASERILVVSACSGHGFKHSAGVGEVAAAVMTGELGGINLAPFALSRFRVAA